MISQATRRLGTSVRRVSYHNSQRSLPCIRSFSSANNTDAQVEETLNKLFEESTVVDSTTTTVTDVATAAWEPTWYNIADQAVVVLQNFHELSGWEYGWSIVGVTVLMRVGLFPVMVSTQRTTSRMAHLQPELTQMKNRYEAIGTPSRQDQLQFSKNMQALFAKYDVKPMRMLMGPILQLPLFMGMFFGLKKLSTICPEKLVNGGMFWFPDLTVTDPLYILPIASSMSFLFLIEIGKDQMMAQNPAQGQLMVNVFRGMTLFMIPVCLSFDSAMLTYWTCNNGMTIGQTMFLKSPAVRQSMGIWEPPKPIPGQEAETLTDVVGNLAKRARGEATNDKQKMANHNKAVEARQKASQSLRRNYSRKS